MKNLSSKLEEFSNQLAKQKLKEETISKISLGRGLELQIKSVQSRKNPRILAMESKIDYEIIKKMPTFSRKIKQLDPNEIETIEGKKYIKIVRGQLTPESKLMDAVKTYSQIQFPPNPQLPLFNKQGRRNGSFMEGTDKGTAGLLFTNNSGRNKSEFFGNYSSFGRKEQESANDIFSTKSKQNISMFEPPLSQTEDVQLPTYTRKYRTNTPFQKLGLKSMKAQQFDNYESYMGIGKKVPNSGRAFTKLQRMYQIDTEFIDPYKPKHIKTQSQLPPSTKLNNTFAINDLNIYSDTSNQGSQTPSQEPFITLGGSRQPSNLRVSPSVDLPPIKPEPPLSTFTQDDQIQGGGGWNCQITANKYLKELDLSGLPHAKYETHKYLGKTNIYTDRSGHGHILRELSSHIEEKQKESPNKSFSLLETAVGGYSTPVRINYLNNSTSEKEKEKKIDKLELARIVNKYQKNDKEDKPLNSEELYARMNKLLNSGKDPKLNLQAGIALREAGYRHELQNMDSQLNIKIKKTNNSLVKRIKQKIRNDLGKVKFRVSPPPVKFNKQKTKINNKPNSKSPGEHSMNPDDLFGSRRNRFNTVAFKNEDIPEEFIEEGQKAGMSRRMSVELRKRRFSKYIIKQGTLDAKSVQKLMRKGTVYIPPVFKEPEVGMKSLLKLVPIGDSDNFVKLREDDQGVIKEVVEEETITEDKEEINLLKKFIAKEEKEKQTIEREENKKKDILNNIIADFALKHKDEQGYEDAVTKLNQKTEMMNQYRKIKNPYNANPTEELNIEYLRECQRVKAVPLPILTDLKDRQLEVSNSRLPPNLCQAIGKLCNKLSEHVNKMKFNSNGLTDESFSSILKGILASPDINELDYSTNLIGAQSVDLLKQIINRQAAHENLRSLELQKCKISPNLVNELLHSMSENTTLSKFGLTDVFLDDIGSKYLSTFIKKNKKLYYLNISYNEISYRNIAKLLSRLSVNKNIHHLNLESWTIGSESIINERDKEKIKSHEKSIKYIGKMIMKNIRLVHLNLSNTRLIDADIYQWLKSLKQSESLNVLHLSGNCISDNCREHMRQYLNIKLSADRVQSKIYQLTTNQDGEQALRNILKITTEAIATTLKAPPDSSSQPSFFKSPRTESQKNQKYLGGKDMTKRGDIPRSRRSSALPEPSNEIQRNKSVINLEDAYILSRVTEHPEIPASSQWLETSHCWICQKWVYTITIFAYDIAYKKFEKVKDDHNFKEILDAQGEYSSTPYLALSTTNYIPIPMNTFIDFMNIVKKGEVDLLDSKLKKVNSHSVYEYILNHTKLIPKFCPDESMLKNSIGKTRMFYMAANFLPPGITKQIFIFKGLDKRLTGGVAEKTLQFYETAANFTPMEQPILCTYLPAVQEHIRVFKKKQSVFRDYKESTPALLKKSLEIDTRLSKIQRYLKYPGDFEEVFEVLLANLIYLRDVFMYCISTSIYPNISWIDFSNNCYEMKIIDKNMPISTIDRLFIAVNVELEKLEDNPDRDLCRYEFLEILVRIATTKYKDTKMVETHKEALSKLLEQIKANSVIKFTGYAFKKEEVWVLEVDDLLRTNIPNIRKIFNKYTSRKFLFLEDAIKLIKESKLKIIEGDIILAYGYAKQIIVNEMDEIELYKRMNFTEFLEFLCRIAYKIYTGKEEHKLSLGKKLERILVNIYSLGHGLRVQAPYIPGSDDEDTGSETN